MGITRNTRNTRNTRANKLVLGAAALLMIGGTAAAALVWTPGSVTLPEVSPGAAAYTYTILINTTPVAIGGMGDTIDTIEVGRDDRGPYTAIEVTFGPNSAHTTGGAAHPCYDASWPMDPMWGIPVFSNFPWDGPGGNPNPPPLTYDCTINSNRFIYRPTNDPLNPGWTSNPGSAGQLEDALAACHVVAEELRAYVNSNGANIPLTGHTPAFPTPTVSPPTVPFIVLETEWSMAGMTTGTRNHGEFYKFRIQSIRNW